MEELVVEFVIPLRYRYPLDDDLSRESEPFDFEDRYQPLREVALRGPDFWLSWPLIFSKRHRYKASSGVNRVCLTCTG